MELLMYWYFISGLEQVNENFYSLFLITPSLKDDLKLKARAVEEVRKDISFAFFFLQILQEKKIDSKWKEIIDDMKFILRNFYKVISIFNT